MLNLALLNQKDNPIEAINYFEKLFNICPEKKEIAGILAKEYFKQGMYDKAIKFGEEVINQIRK